VNARPGGDEGGVDLVAGRRLVHASREQLGRAVTAAAVDGRPVRWVVADPSPADDAAAAGASLAAHRDVLQLRRPLPLEPSMSGEAGAVEVRPLRPGSADEQAWLACNNRAFAAHPDQSGYTVGRLHQTMAEPWFDPAGFLLHEENDRLVGFCWTKVHPPTAGTGEAAEPALGEIYVIGIDPDAGGRGLGRALTIAGLDSLAARGLMIGMLYVDATNVGARRMYDRLGFALHHLDRIYETI